MNTSSRVNSGEYLQNLLVQLVIIWSEGFSGRNYFREPKVSLFLAKSFNPNRREIRVPEYRQGVKDPNTTQWRRGPVRHTSMLVKVFVMSRLDFGQRVGKGIPTGSRLWYQLVTPPIWPYTNHTRKHVRSRSRTHEKISQHNSTNKISYTSIILQARGLEGSNTRAR